MLVVVTVLANQINDFNSTFLRKSFPQTCHQTTDGGRRERSTHVLYDDATAVDQEGGRTDGYYIRFEAPVLRGSHRTEGRYVSWLISCDGAYGQNVVSIGRHANLLPRAHAGIACRIDEDDTLAG